MALSIRAEEDARKWRRFTKIVFHTFDNMDLFLDQLESPIGTIVLISDGEALRVLDFVDCEERMQRLLKLHYGDKQPVVNSRESSAIRHHVEAYFAGDLTSVDTIAVRTEGTPFQKQVWAELRHITAGTTLSYGELAKRIGRPSASRAVGLANGSNPIAIVVPCHRVIGSNGSLTGYGGGMERKQWLLEHEGAASRNLFNA
jgi:methylated-DNA-[protein]-cysteine S-methyltransferase